MVPHEANRRAPSCSRRRASTRSGSAPIGYTARARRSHSSRTTRRSSRHSGGGAWRRIRSRSTSVLRVEDLAHDADRPPNLPRARALAVVVRRRMHLRLARRHVRAGQLAEWRDREAGDQRRQGHRGAARGARFRARRARQRQGHVHPLPQHQRRLLLSTRRHDQERPVPEPREAESCANGESLSAGHHARDGARAPGLLPSDVHRRARREMRALLARRSAAIIVAMMLVTVRAPLSAQHHSAHGAPVVAGLDDSSIARFVAQARAGTDRYRDRTVAIDEGFRLVGPDFPGMGEHWINVARLLSARFDPGNPAMLQYADIDGRPTLVAVTYALALVGGDSAPAFPSRALWHQHRNTVDEESLIDQHVLDDSHRGGRIAMLHAWVWLENPDGLFQSD